MLSVGVSHRFWQVLACHKSCGRNTLCACIDVANAVLVCATMPVCARIAHAFLPDAPRRAFNPLKT